jgi:hypothetical protein
MRVTNDVRKLLAWLEGAPVPEAQIVAAGFNHTLDKALMLNFVEMNLPKATVSITARGLAANAFAASERAAYMRPGLRLNAGVGSQGDRSVHLASVTQVSAANGDTS